MPAFSELTSILPVLFSLVLVETLLSVDNALAIASMASHLPPDRQKLALRLGIIGAYLFRGVCLFAAGFIVHNPWLKALGALYLVYLMASHLSEKEGGDGGQGLRAGAASFWGTVLQIELLDLSVSLDNVVAAVALDDRLWVVITGVFIGILALRFLAGVCIELVERFPVLNHTAFLLIGFVGMLLLTELGAQHFGHPLHLGPVVKMGGIITIVGISIVHEQSAVMRRICTPLLFLGRPLLRAIHLSVQLPLRPFALLLRALRPARGKDSAD